MKNLIRVALLMGATLGCLLSTDPLYAQACKDDEAVVEDYKKSVNELVQTVKKESLVDFQRAYHQKSCLTKLTLCGISVERLVSCLEKASQDTTVAKEEVEAYKAKREPYAKLKEKVQQERSRLKATEAPKDAKALIEKIELSN